MKKNTCVRDVKFPSAMPVKDPEPDTLDGRRRYFSDGDTGSCCGDEEAVRAFDSRFPEKEKKWMPSQEEFFIHCHSVLRNE